MTSLFLDNTIRVLLALLHPPQPAPAPPPAPPTAASSEDEAATRESVVGETIEVTSDAPAESASSVHLDQRALRFRPRTQPSDILRQVPGLVVSQHAGGGKSDQYFIRGFDADHGTDIAIFADGVPVNLPSHGHGQGYADTHWMIPETIESVDIHKGPYAARYGDFYTAGALELKTIDEVKAPTVWVASGSPLGQPNRFARYDKRLVGMASPRLRRNADDRSLIALQVAENDGPFIAPQNFRQGNALIKWKGELGPGELGLAATWYAGKWNQSGQLPEREIAAGRLDRFGSLDPSEGGVASRASLQLGYRVRDAANRSTWRVMAYGVRNDLELYSNFTLFARDTTNGDQIEQRDDRFLYGFDAGYARSLQLGSLQMFLNSGVQARSDHVETSLFHTSKRERLELCSEGVLNPCNRTDNRIGNLAAYIEVDAVPVAWLHVRPGIRVDGFSWDVDDLDPETASDPSLTTGGDTTKAIASPKLSIELHASEQLTIFLNGGSGFHSNDARSAVATGGRGSLARALGAETGLRVKPLDRARVSADVWYLYLTSEQVWSGDAGGTEASDPTRRFGVDLEGSIDATRWLSLDANVTWAKSAFVANRGNADALALAPRWMGSGGVTVHARNHFASLRARGVGDRSGNDDGTLTAKGFMLFDVVAGKKLGQFGLELTITNLLNAEWREAQFAEESRITPVADVMEQIHFTPGSPLTATLKASYEF